LFQAEVRCSVKYRHMVLMPTDPKFIKGYYLKYINILELSSENLTHTYTNMYNCDVSIYIVVLTNFRYTRWENLTNFNKSLKYHTNHCTYIKFIISHIKTLKCSYMFRS